MSTEDYTEEDLAGLSEEEKAAILDGDGGDGDASGDDGGDGDASGDDGDDVADDSQGDGGVDDVSGSDGQHDDLADNGHDDNAEVGDGEKEGVKTENPVAPQISPETLQKSMTLPEDVADSFKERLKFLTNEFEEGRLEMSDLLDGRDKINREIYNAEVAVAEQQEAVNSWKKAQDDFFDANKQYEKDETRYATLNMCVKVLASSEMASGMSLQEILAKAKTMEEAMSGAPATTVAATKEKTPLPSSPRPKVPNLGDIPASSSNDAGGEFSNIDKLTGIELETALAAMSDAKRERYLKG